MENGFWQTIGGVVVGAAITALANPIQAYVFGPRLRVVFHVGAFGKVKTTEHHRDGGRTATMGLGPGQAGKEVEFELSYFTRDVVYVRLRVDNAWRGTLKNCRGFLVDIERELEGGKLERVFFDSIPLSWSYLVGSNLPGAVDIPAGVTFNLDVLSTQRDKDAYTPRLAAIPTCYEPLFKQHGSYRWTIAVTADNAKPAVTKLRLKWAGKWDDFTIEEIPDREW